MSESISIGRLINLRAFVLNTDISQRYSNVFRTYKIRVNTLSKIFAIRTSSLLYIEGCEKWNRYGQTDYLGIVLNQFEISNVYLNLTEYIFLIIEYFQGVFLKKNVPPLKIFLVFQKYRRTFLYILYIYVIHTYS